MQVYAINFFFLYDNIIIIFFFKLISYSNLFNKSPITSLYNKM